MKRIHLIWFLILSLAITSACGLFTQAAETPTSTPLPPPTQSEVQPTQPVATTPPTPQPSPTIEMTPTISLELSPSAPVPERPTEEILILSPGPGSRVTSPIRIKGEANTTFEQNLGVRILRDDGTEILATNTIIQAELGQRGPFSLEVPLALDEEANVFIQVFSASPRDGGITHLASTAVLFTPSGPEEIRPRSAEPEQIAISLPQANMALQAGLAHVEGFALASFEQTLLVEVLDADGNVVGSQPVIVQAPDIGFPGPFSVDVPYTISAAGPGRVVVRDISPAHGKDSHLSSVEVTLGP